jgi:mRNA interferase MazF
MSRRIVRGDVYYAELDPVIGSEQGGLRPVLVLQNNNGNAYAPTVIVAAITSRVKPILPTHLPLSCTGALKNGSVVLLEQLRTIDKLRLRRYVCSVGPATLRLVESALAVSLGMGHRGLSSRSVMVMVLCSVCKGNFEDGGLHLHPLSDTHDARETCDYCGMRTGYTYEVKGA